MTATSRTVGSVSVGSADFDSADFGPVNAGPGRTGPAHTAPAAAGAGAGLGAAAARAVGPRSGAARGPNERLGTLLALAQISNAGLARRVNDLGAQRGLTLRYDKTSVARWVSKGMVPQGPVPHLIATAIGGKLGRPVPLDEIGLGDSDPTPEVGLVFPREVPDAIRAATDLWRVDLELRRSSGGGRWSDSLAGTFSVAGYATPVSRWLINPADGSVTREVAAADRTGCRVGFSDAAKLREAAQEARRWDSKYGGGDWRSSMVPECLRVEAAPLLLASYSDAVGRALFGATAELTRLAGWMAFDTGQHEAAQRYYIQALRLARAAADVPLGGYVLASMSLQAGYRGFAEEAVDLAQAALERNRSLATARTMSFFHLVEARAQAKAANAPACAAALAAAEGSLERARAGDADPSWIDFYAYDRLAADAAECFGDLGVPAKVRQFTREALARPTERFVRSHGLRLVVAAMAEAESGDLDAAVAAGERAVDVAGRISSQRSREYVQELLRRLQPHQDERRVRDLTERARLTLAAPA